MSKNYEGYLRPIRSQQVLAAGTFAMGQFNTVARIYAAATTQVTFNGTGTTLTIVGGAPPEYFRTMPGGTITATGAVEITEMG